MSRVYFHSPSEPDVELRGAERAHLQQLVSRIFLAAVGPVVEWGDCPSPLRALAPPGHYLHNIPVGAPQFEKSMTTFLSLAWDDIMHKGEKVGAFSVVLNTAALLGSDVVQLAAHVHGQCEIHAFVRGPNRKWLASKIRAGRAQNVLRPDMGWEAVADLLERRDDEPVVTSYSVCAQFPSPIVLPPDHPARANDCDDWYDLPHEERWRLGLAWLEDNAPEWKPETWPNGFRDGLHIFDILADNTAKKEAPK